MLIHTYTPPRVFNRTVACLLSALLFAGLITATSPAHADGSVTCDDTCQARYAQGSVGYSNKAGFYIPESQYWSSNNRLVYPQTGDKGFHWAVAGDKDVRSRHIANATLPDQEIGSGYEQGGAGVDRPAVRDLQAACLKGNDPGRCSVSDNRPMGIYWDYFGNSLDYRRNAWGSQFNGGYWTIYLQDSNGGLSWGNSANYGSVATVGELRNFLKSEISKGAGSEFYRYNLGRALVYLDLVYADDNEHPIEMLSIPDNWWFVCYTPKQNPDGSLMRDFYGNVMTEVHQPITYASEYAYDPYTRAMSCPPLTDGHWEYSYESQIRGWSEVIDINIAGPYSNSTEVRDDSPSGVGRTTFATQGEERLTPLGQKLNEVCEAHGGCDDTTVFSGSELDALEAAANASQDQPSPKVDLTDHNKQALADGRLVFVGAWTRDVRITKHEQRDRWMRRWIETRTHYDDAGNVMGTETKVGDWEYANDPDKDIRTGEATFTMGTPRFDQGYQVLVNHCNGTAFDQVAGNRSIDERPVGGTTFTGSYLAGSAVSDTFTNPANKPWGVTGPTAEVGFYDKVCSYEGTRTDPDTEQATTATVRGDDTAFRDNSYQDLPVTYYTPTSSGWVNYQGDGPVGVTATRWDGGTPVPGQFWLVGRDCVTGNYSDGYFGTDHRDAPVLRQWTMQDFSSTSVATAVGCYKRLYTRSIWASDRAKPQVLTVKWDYTPRVATVIPTQNIGFTATGGSSYDKAPWGAVVRGQVESSHEVGAATVPAHQDRYMAHTGSGTENTLDVALPHGGDINGLGQWNSAPHLFDAHYYAVRVVRAVGS